MNILLRRGLLAVLAVAAAIIAGCSVGPLQPGDKIITARFDNANGLFEGNAVSVLGMKVGRIDDVRPAGTGVDIELHIDPTIQLPADVQAVAVSDSLLTDRRIELTPAYKGGPELPDKAVLGLERTRVPVEFDSLLAMAEKLTTALGGDGQGNGPVADVMGLSDQITHGNGPGMRAALTELANAMRLGSDNGAAQKEAITTVVRNLDALVAAAARNDQTLREFGSGVHQLSDLLAEEGIGTGDTGTRMNRILLAVTDLLTKNIDKISGLAGNAGTLTQTMVDYNANLGEFMDIFPMLTNNAYYAVDPELRAVRAHVDVPRFLLDGQMVKEICNLLHLTELGCDTGDMRDLGPDYGISAILTALAEGQGR